VVVGSARDIVEECGVARFVFVDFPLGNPCGKPGDVAMQSRIVSLAVSVLASAVAPRTTVQAPEAWDPTDEGWRERFMLVDESNRAALAAAGEERRAMQARAKADRED